MTGSFSEQVRIKENSFLAKLAARKLRSRNMAVVLGGTIYLYNVSEADFRKNKAWLRHELTHIRQFRRYGFLPFLLRYLWESTLRGYYNNRYEVEAREAESGSDE